VLAVQDPEEWHRENLQRNPRHYAFVPRMMGAHAIAAVQRNMGAGIYYNTGVSVGEQVKRALTVFGG
jgi:translocator assembly and maintenance protein 41